MDKDLQWTVLSETERFCSFYPSDGNCMGIKFERPEKYETERFRVCSNIIQKVVEAVPRPDPTILIKAVAYLWSLPQVQHTFKKREVFSFIENMDHYLNKSDVIFGKGYEPTIQDTLKCRIRTTGLIEEKYIINDIQFNIFDCGGTRNERKKWIALFEGVSAVIYLAALSHYCRVLFEDECKNAMQESLQLFDEVCNAKWFKRTEIILFLNMNDLFRERLREGVSLSIAFGDDWKGPDYIPQQDDEEKDDQVFEECYKAAVDFIRERYEQLNRNPFKRIFVHITTSSDRDNIEKVFWDVQNIVVNSNFTRGGLL